MSIFELFAQTYPPLDDDRTDPGIAADCGGARASLWFVICFKDYFFTGNFTCIH